MLETTNTCSLACVHCSVAERGHPHHEKTGFLPVELADALFADLRAVRARFDTLILFWLGEPLLHPFFGHIYQMALRAAVEDQVFGKVEIHTNATHLNQERIRFALNAAPVPQVWHFSLDAIHRETYRRIKGVDRCEVVMANIEAFLDRKAALKARWPRPVFQFIVSDKNAAEIPAYRAFWEQACRKRGLPVRAAAQNVPEGDDAIIFFRQLDAPTPSEQVQQNAVFRAAMATQGLSLGRPEKAPDALLGGNKAVCSGFWKSPVIGWDGRVTVCTRDNRLENAVGSLKDHRFSELWWGPTMRARRSCVSRGDYSGLNPCKTCFIPRSSNYTDITPSEIQAHG